MADARKRPTRGFTLIELAVVMVIIGILISFILVAARGGVRRAEERATQSLLLKLDTGLSDRIEALLSASVEPSLGHQELARVYYDSSDFTKWIKGDQRAAVIAQFDMMRAELPDVFLVVPPSGGGYAANDYPLNFAAQPFPVVFGGDGGPEQDRPICAPPRAPR
ncbi:MAG: type II secretion system protein [Singulisphaera sp.]